MFRDKHIEETKENPGRQHPRVAFLLGGDLDCEKFTNLMSVSRKKGGADMRQVILGAHPNLAGVEVMPPVEAARRIREYVKGYCQDHRKELEKARAAIESEWPEYAPRFFAATDDIFARLRWPEGEYRGYISIGPPYMRVLDSKVFHLPYDSIERAIRVSSHEMAHIMFYEYVRQRYTPGLPNTIELEMDRLLDGRFKIPLWEMSEAFNIVVLSDERFGRGRGRNSVGGYSGLAGYLEQLRQVWGESGGYIGKFFSKMERT